MSPLETLRHHVSGAIECGEAVAIVEQKETVCKSVVGGWQSYNPDQGGLFGPVFNKTTDLWNWQSENLKGVTQ